MMPASKSAEKLIKFIRTKSKAKAQANEKPAQLIMYFDESHHLTSAVPANDDGKGHSCYMILCSVINSFKHLDLFTIFLSTSWKIVITSSSPPPKVLPSARVRVVKLGGVQTPFNELPFDEWKEPYLLEEGTHTLREVCLPSFMVRFGRPL